MNSEKLQSLPITENWEEYYKPKKFKIYDFQVSIIKNAESYLDSPEFDKNKNEFKAALIKMPTGTGKSVIMSILSNYKLKNLNILIVVPAEVLKSQLVYFMNFKHWDDTHKRPKIIKESFYFEPIRLSSFLSYSEKKKYNFICTTKTIGDLWEYSKKDDPKFGKLYNKLINKVDVLFIDEGHREPAKVWSKAVRKFNKPTLLFTATPYRNDLRFFNIGKSKFELTHQEALKNKSIRQVEIEYSKLKFSKINYKTNKIISDPKIFAEEFVDYFFKKVKLNSIRNPKAIIRCDSQESIKKVQDQLMILLGKEEVRSKYKIESDPRFKGRDLSVAIHDQFTNTDQDKFRFQTVDAYVKYKKNYDPIFWIHQFKLTEGIDKPEFFMVGFFEPFGNARSLVQQIGRIIRNPEGNISEFAYVFSDEIFNLKEIWQGYLSYEKVPKDKKIFGTEEVVERILSSFPDYFYFYKNYSKVTKYKFSKDEFEKFIETELSIPKITNIFTVKKDIDINELLDNISQELVDQDILEVDKGTKDYDDINAALFIGWKIKPTEHLKKSLFFDISFTAFSFFKYKNYLFFRGNINLMNLVEYGLIDYLNPSQLEKLITPKDNTIPLEIKQISVMNSDSNLDVVRRRIEGANNLINSSSYLNDHLQIVTSAVTEINYIPRYVGLTRSRLTDNRGTFISIDEYTKWIKNVVKQIESIVPKNIFLERYAKHIDDVDNVIPKHIMVDFKEFLQIYRDPDLDVELFTESFREFSSEINNWDPARKTANFDLQIRNLKGDGYNNYPFILILKNKKFKLQPRDNKVLSKLNKDYKLNDINESAANFIRNNLVFRVITEGGQFYTEGFFFNPSIPLWGSNRLEHIATIYGIEEMSEVEFEKEEKDVPWNSKLRSWPEKSLFELIDSFRNSNRVKYLNQKYPEELFFDPEYLICDDKSGEVGDFIAFSESENIVVLISAKMAKTPGTQSSLSFENVSTQAIKNLRIFDPFNINVNDFNTKWGEKWKDQYGDEQLKRIRKGKSKSTRIILNKLIKLLKSGASREVWIMYGQGFSKQELFSELRKRNPVYHVKHLTYSLLNCNEAVSRFGAKLKIFTQP